MRDFILSDTMLVKMQIQIISQNLKLSQNVEMGDMSGQNICRILKGRRVMNPTFVSFRLQLIHLTDGHL